MKTGSNHSIKLAQFWPYKAVFLADQISKFTLNVARETANLNLSQWRVLAAIAETPDRTAAYVTRVTPMDKTIVSRAVQSLITLGLIKKTPDAHDKRRMTLTATKTGMAVYTEIASPLSAALTPDIDQDAKAAQLLDLLNGFITRMDDIAPPEK